MTDVDATSSPESFDEKEFFRHAYSTVRQCVFTGVSPEQVDEFEEACSDAEELLSDTDAGLYGLDDDFPFFYDFVMAPKNFSVTEDANGRMDTSLSFSDYFRRVLFDVARDVANARANLTDDVRHIIGDTPEVEALERAFEPLRELFRVQDAIKRGEIDDW